MTIARIEKTELDRVQHQLDHLASARCLGELNEAEDQRYRELCRAERALLASR